MCWGFLPSFLKPDLRDCPESEGDKDIFPGYYYLSPCKEREVIEDTDLCGGG
jgi:hypothetical protein